MILSDRTLREQIAQGRIIIEPFDDSFVQPSSIDVRISNLFRVFRNFTARVIDVKEDMATLTEPVEIEPDGVFMLHPGEFVLGSTFERIGVPADLVGRIEGKSSLGRLGLIIHSTAGFIDAGFDHITLELTNIATLPIRSIAHEDRSGQLHADDHARRQALWQRRRFEVPRPARPHAEPVLRELRPLTSRQRLTNQPVRSTTWKAGDVEKGAYIGAARRGSG